MHGFSGVLREILMEAGLPEGVVYCKPYTSGLVLPGWFRPTKDWDLLVVSGGELLAAIELKSHVGPSFGNNFNNRTEEAVGNGADLRAAYREGAFRPSPRPWLGYLMLLESCPQSVQPVRIQEPHFNVFPEFKDSSYAKRYEIFCTKLVREHLYDAACLILSERAPAAQFTEPSAELTFEKFTRSLRAMALAYVAGRRD